MTKAGLHLALAASAWLVVIQADTLSTTQDLSVGLRALGKVSVASTLALSTAGSAFSPYTGVLPVSYRVRTSRSGGGLITAQATSDFSPSGGPSIASGIVQFTCSGASLGTPCSGTQVLKTTSQSTILTIPAGVCTGGGVNGCSTADPNTVSVAFTLENNPQYQTGNYSAQITFTISAI